MSDVFGLWKQSPGLSLFSSLIPKLSAQSAVNRQAPKPLLARCIDPLTCASETSPDPTRAVVTVGLKTSPNIYKISLFPYLGYLSYYSRPSDYDRRDLIPPKPIRLAIYSGNPKLIPSF